MDRIRVGFVGAGNIASRHLGNLLQFADVEVVAIADLALERAGAQAQRGTAHPYADYQEMVDKEAPDALYICVPPFAHGDIEELALERNLPFFVEKPLATTWEKARQISKRVAAQQLITAVGYHWRYLDTTQTVKEMLATNPAAMVLGYWLDFTPPVAWWVRQDQSGGQMIEQTTHIFDLARYLVGEVTQVYGVGNHISRPEWPEADVFDASLATLHFASGAIGNMASTCLLGWPHRIGLHLFCNRLAIELTEFELALHDGSGHPIRRAEGDPFVREDRDFIDAVQGKANRIRTPYAEALKTHRITVAATQSAREGTPITLTEEE